MQKAALLLLLQQQIKGRELNSATTLASQPAASHILSFITTIVITT